MESEHDIECAGFIMDGNRRFARERGLETLEGHRLGMEVFQDSISWVKEFKIPHAVYYAFSTENWSRDEKEVGYLMELCGSLVAEMTERAEKNQVRCRLIGRRGDFSEDLQKQMAILEQKTASYTETTIWIALSYGGRAEIVSAVNEAIERGERVDEESFKNLLWSAEMPDPDLIIRTGGEQRLSNFMTWGSVYSELFFTPTYWPAFTKEEFARIVEAYGKRTRRKGK